MRARHWPGRTGRDRFLLGQSPLRFFESDELEDPQGSVGGGFQDIADFQGGRRIPQGEESGVGVSASTRSSPVAAGW